MVERQPKRIKQEQQKPPIKGDGVNLPGGIPVNADIDEIAYHIRLKAGGLPRGPLSPEQFEWARKNKARGSE